MEGFLFCSAYLQGSPSKAPLMELLKQCSAVLPKPRHNMSDCMYWLALLHCCGYFLNNPRTSGEVLRRGQIVMPNFISKRKKFVSHYAVANDKNRWKLGWLGDRITADALRSVSCEFYNKLWSPRVCKEGLLRSKTSLAAAIVRAMDWPNDVFFMFLSLDEMNAFGRLDDVAEGGKSILNLDQFGEVSVASSCFICWKLKGGLFSSYRDTWKVSIYNRTGDWRGGCDSMEDACREIVNGKVWDTYSHLVESSVADRVDFSLEDVTGGLLAGRIMNNRANARKAEMQSLPSEVRPAFWKARVLEEVATPQNYYHHSFGSLPSGKAPQPPPAYHAALFELARLVGTTATRIEERVEALDVEFEKLLKKPPRSVCGV